MAILSYAGLWSHTDKRYTFEGRHYIGFIDSRKEEEKNAFMAIDTSQPNAVISQK